MSYSKTKSKKMIDVPKQGNMQFNRSILVLRGLSRCQASVVSVQSPVRVPSLFCTNNEGLDQPGQMLRLIRVFITCTGYFFVIVMLHLKV